MLRIADCSVRGPGGDLVRDLSGCRVGSADDVAPVKLGTVELVPHDLGCGTVGEAMTPTVADAFLADVQRRQQQDIVRGVHLGGCNEIVEEPWPQDDEGDRRQCAVSSV